MNNKKSLLQDSLQELENIKNESLELAKEQLINESADLLEKKSAALFEKIITGEDIEEEDIKEEEEAKEEKNESLNEILNELKNAEDEDSDEDMNSDEIDSEENMDSDEEDMDDSDDEEISLDDLRKAAEEHGFKLVQADSDDEEDMDSDEEDMDSDEEDMDSDEEDMDDSDDDIEFGDEESDDEESDDEFMTTNVDNTVLAKPSDDEESFQKINENFKRNNTKMRNTKKQVLKDLRDVSFNKLVEAYYNMGDNDSFIIKENEYMEEDLYDEEYGHSMMDEDLFEDESYEEGWNMDEEESPFVPNINKSPKNKYDLYAHNPEKFPVRTGPDGSRYSYEKMGRDTVIKNYPSSEDEEMYGSQDEELIYEIDMPDEGWNMDEMALSDEQINEMLAEMGAEETMHDVEEASGFNKMQPKSEIEEMFEQMTMEELEEMNALLQEEGDGESMTFTNKGKDGMKIDVDPRKDYPMEEDYSNLTEAQIEEMLNSMKEEEMLQEDELEEDSLANFRTKMRVRNMGADAVAQGRPDRRSKPTLAEDEMEDAGEVETLREQLKKLKAENKALNEGFTNKVKSLENKVYDVTISALKAGFVNKFLLEHPLRENEKLQIIHRFANAQTKEQIKETYISLTNEFAKGQTVKDGSMLNESVQNKVGKIHRTDNALVKEKDLINESDESNRFKQLLNYNFGKKK